MEQIPERRRRHPNARLARVAAALACLSASYSHAASQTAHQYRFEIANDTDPIHTISVSDDLGGPRFVVDFVRAVTEASYPNPTPNFIVFGSKATHKEVGRYQRSLRGREKVRVFHPKQPPKTRPTGNDPLKDRIHLANAKRWNWQQDFYQPFVNPENGAPILREVGNYDRHEDAFQGIAGASRKIGGIEIGPRLSTPRNGTGFAGGNIEGLPGNYVVLGADGLSDPEFQNYAKEMGAGVAGVIKAPSHFLVVGHVDEFFHVIPAPGEAPCNFAIGLSSDIAFLKSLAQDPDGFFIDAKNSDREENNRRLKEMSWGHSFCVWVSRMRARGSAPAPESPPASPESHSAHRTSWLLAIPAAYAGVKTGAPQCDNVSNREFLEYYRSPEGKDFRAFNELAQREIDRFQRELKVHFAKTLPQCSNISFVGIPQLFEGEVTWKDGNPSLVKSSGLSILPNSSNSVLAHKTAIFSDPMNAGVRRYLDDSYRSLGLKTDYVDTFFAHLNHGNLHCSSNAIRHRPTSRPSDGASPSQPRSIPQ